MLEKGCRQKALEFLFVIYEKAHTKCVPAEIHTVLQILPQDWNIR